MNLRSMSFNSQRASFNSESPRNQDILFHTFDDIDYKDSKKNDDGDPQ